MIDEGLEMEEALPTSEKISEVLCPADSLNTKSGGWKELLSKYNYRKDPEKLITWQQVRLDRAKQLVGDVSVRILGSGELKKLEHTGFEGYFANLSSAEIVDEIAKIGMELESSLKRDHEKDPQYVYQAKKVLQKREFNQRILTDWNVIFGAIIAKLRPRVMQSEESHKFHEETEEMVKDLPDPSYEEENGQIVRTYQIRRTAGDSSHHMLDLTERQYKGYELMQLLGSSPYLVDPLMRSFLTYHSD